MQTNIPAAKAAAQSQQPPSRVTFIKFITYNKISLLAQSWFLQRQLAASKSFAHAVQGVPQWH
jgi:hypothetical protein